VTLEGVKIPRGPHIVKLKRPQKSYHYVIAWRQEGKLRRRFFLSRAQAKLALRVMLNEVQQHGNGALELTASDREMLIEAKTLLEPYDASLIDAVRQYVETQKRIHGSRIVTELAIEFLHHKEQAGARQRYRKDLRRVLDHFSDDFGNRLAAGIDPAEITRWIESRSTQWERANHRRILSAFFAYSKAIGAVLSNPINDVPKPRVPVAATEIFTVQEARKLLFGASEHVPGLVPYLAIGLFAGLRTAELGRLDWSDVTDSAIRVEPRTSKTASRRVIEMSENLRGWLLPFRKASGPIQPTNDRKLRERLCELTNMRWKPNGMRHTFASNHLAVYENAGKTAFLLGHASPALVFRHYRELVNRRDAETFWKLSAPPIPQDDKLVAFG
jgi:integrase